MSYEVIARKWRPQTFEEVTGQEAITQTLRNALEYDRLHHAYLFSGARGVGKTTTARLLAKALNCHKNEKPTATPCSFNDPEACASCREIAESRSIDVLEFDAASHTKVEEIREIILEGINVAPARDRYKIFIIDEVHMLSTSSFNALLKTLEEPPPNVVFIMATTELHKVPETILSRCQQFEFRTIPLQKIFARLKLIAEAERINITDEALREIARSGEGSMRDAQSNFDQVISFSGEKIDAVDVAKALGIASAENLQRIVTAIAHHQPAEVLKVVDDLISRGHDLRSFCRDLLSFFRDLLITKIAEGNENLLETAILSPDELKKYAIYFSESDLIRFFNSLSETEMKLRDAIQSRYVLEIGLVKLVEMRRVAPIENILERLAKLEEIILNETPAEKKTLKFDIPPAETPFPTENRTHSQAVSAPMMKNSSDSVLSQNYGQLHFSGQPEMPDESSKAALKEILSVKSVKDKKPLRSEIIDTMPVRLPPVSAEDLEHFEDARLDEIYENKLLQSGDKLFPIKNAEKLAYQLLGQKIDESIGHQPDNQRGIATAATPAKANQVMIIPDFDTEPAETEEMPVLPENPTEEELFEYASKHPIVKKVLRKFGGKIVEVKKL
jgi:DNA polymerase-3 subunit gamma/tau